MDVNSRCELIEVYVCGCVWVCVCVCVCARASVCVVCVFISQQFASARHNNHQVQGNNSPTGRALGVCVLGTAEMLDDPHHAKTA